MTIKKKDLLRLENIALKEENRKIREACSYAVNFVEHIQSHLKDDQVPICKICGKTIFEINKVTP